MSEQFYNKLEREEMLRRMNTLSNFFYGKAALIGCHPFIEFNGFMNEWLKIARKASDSGVDFTQANTHTGQPLHIEPYEAKYIAEKFDCIFGPSLRANPKAMDAFVSFLKGEGSDGNEGEEPIGDESP